MAQDLLRAGKRRCFACIQWDGKRSYEPQLRIIKTDQGANGNCRVKHATIKGSAYCDRFDPLR
ncbi:MAG: hypothetical protein Q8M76_05255 [Spirochaetaceae bacterium]|nr:hypothetical protein [Spirochaetaceae bacterium]